MLWWVEGSVSLWIAGSNFLVDKRMNTKQNSILAKARTPFHLAALEATYITIHQPVLCRHKEFVYALQISH